MSSMDFQTQVQHVQSGLYIQGLSSRDEAMVIAARNLLGEARAQLFNVSRKVDEMCNRAVWAENKNEEYKRRIAYLEARNEALTGDLQVVEKELDALKETKKAEQRRKWPFA